MPLWEIPCESDGDRVIFRVSLFGEVRDVEPPTSPFAQLHPVSVDGFSDPGVSMTPGEAPALLIADVLRNGSDVIGKALILRAHMVFVSGAQVVEPIRLVSDNTPSDTVSPPTNEWEVGEWFQQAADTPQHGDDAIITLTRLQALRIAAIVGAASTNELYLDALSDVELLFQVLAAEAAPGNVSHSVSAQDAWARVEGMPWPRRPKTRDDSAD